MSKFVKLDPKKPMKVPKGFRIGGVIVNGTYMSRPQRVIDRSSIDDDNNFLRKLQQVMFHRSIEWMKNKMSK